MQPVVNCFLRNRFQNSPKDVALPLLIFKEHPEYLLLLFLALCKESGKDGIQKLAGESVPLFLSRGCCA